MIALTYKNPICTEHGWNQGPPPPISIVMETVIQIPQLQWKPSEFFFPHWYCWDPSAMGRLRKEPGVLLTSRWWCKYGRVPKASLTEDLASPGCLTVILLTPIFFFLSYRANYKRRVGDLSNWSRVEVCEGVLYPARSAAELRKGNPSPEPSPCCRGTSGLSSTSSWREGDVDTCLELLPRGLLLGQKEE